MTSFIALYRGRTVGEARLIAVTADASIIVEVCKRLLQNQEESTDKIIDNLTKGRLSAIQMTYQEATNEERDI